MGQSTISMAIFKFTNLNKLPEGSCCVIWFLVYISADRCGFKPTYIQHGEALHVRTAHSLLSSLCPSQWDSIWSHHNIYILYIYTYVIYIYICVINIYIYSVYIFLYLLYTHMCYIQISPVTYWTNPERPGADGGSSFREAPGVGRGHQWARFTGTDCSVWTIGKT